MPLDEDPFATRPEDHINRALKAGLSLFLPAAIMEYVNAIVGEPALERRDDFLRLLADELQGLGKTVVALRADVLRKNVQFQASFLQAVQIQSRTADEMKRNQLRNAVLNTALLPVRDEYVRQIFMTLIDRFTSVHVAVLSVLDDPPAGSELERKIVDVKNGGLRDAIHAVAPELTDRPEMTWAIVGELQASGLIGNFNIGEKLGKPGSFKRWTTRLGRDFLEFVADPEPSGIETTE